LDDIPLFLHFFVEKYAKWMGKKFDIISQRTIEALQCYQWPGNIRELENVIERAVITSQEGDLRIAVPSASDNRLPDDTEVLHELNRRHILAVLGNVRWKIEGRNGAAQRLGLKPSTLRTRMAKLGIKRPTPK
jgi:transcriptional regulator with GAF, ATPase, and Fis domain